MQTEECTTCNLCNSADKFSDKSQQQKVFCHVRSHCADSFTVWRCDNCLSLHSKEPADLEFYYADYPFKKHTLDFHTRIGYKKRISLLKSRGMRPEHSIIDVGCGKGLFVEALQKAGFSKACGYDFFVPEYSNPEILKNKYDIVLSYDVIEHVEDPRQFLGMLISMLNPGGFLFLTTPNAEEINLASTPLQPELSQPFHRHIFSSKALIGMARDMGLKLESFSRRSYFDTLVPAVNLRFMWACLNMSGGMLDSAVEPPPWAKILRNPRLVFLALFGYFFRARGNMALSFTPQGSS